MRPFFSSWPVARLPLVLTVAVALAIIGAKFELINDFGSDVPYGDQWFGELTCTYAPWLQHEFGFTRLFAAHNEHRIVFTRLLDLGLLELNGNWDPRLQMVVDTFLLLSAVIFLQFTVSRRFSPLLQAIFSILIVGFFGSSVLWENTLNGFQSQFYFLLLFSLLHVLLTIDARPFSTKWWIGNSAGLCNLFTMAPGLLSAPAVLGWLAWRRFRCGKSEAGDIYTAGWNLILLLAGALMLPASLPATGFLPPTITEWLKIFLQVLSWPVVEWQFGLLVWTPAIAFLGWNFFRRPANTGQGWLLGLVLLALLFILSISVGRGGIASRYEDLFSVGMIANWLCLVTWASNRRWCLVLAISGTLWLSLVVRGLWKQEELSHTVTLSREAALQQKRTDAIRRFLSTGDPTFLRQGNEFSEMDVGILISIYDKPAIRKILPLSIRPPLEVQAVPSSIAGGFLYGGAPVLPGALIASPVWGTWSPLLGVIKGEWKSEPVKARGSLLVFFVAGEISPPFTELFLLTSDGQKIPPLQDKVSALDRWHQVNFFNPGRSFQIVAHSASVDHWLAFSAPLEYARGSRMAGKFLHIGSTLRRTGWILLIIVSAVVLVAWLREEDSKTTADEVH